MQNLLPRTTGHTTCPVNDEIRDAPLATAKEGRTPRRLRPGRGPAYPASSAAWAALAERALAAGAGRRPRTRTPAPAITAASTSCAATAGRGRPGAVVARAEPGLPACLYVLARAAGAIGEADEAARCAQFLRDCDPAAADALSSF